MLLEQFSVEFWKTKTKVSQQPFRAQVHIIVSQQELKVKTGKCMKRGKTRVTKSRVV